MALLGALVLVFIVLFRPMEIWPELGQLMLLEVVSVLTAMAIAWEAFTASRTRGLSPQIAWLSAFLVWGFAATIAKLGVDGGLAAMRAVMLAPIFMLLVMFALSSLERLRAMAGLLIALLALISLVAIHQGAQPRQCVELHEEDDETAMVGDGRACEGNSICEKEGARPNTDYRCERAGLFGTHSAGGRVRWRGQLDDPNELAVYIGIVLPFVAWLVAKREPSPAKGFFGRHGALIAALPVVLLGLWAVVLTQSRGGQIVLCAVVLMIFVRRFGPWSIAAALPLLVPVILLSWREGAEAESSSLERANILAEGLELLRGNLFLGVGAQQFSNEVSIGYTAHNSYLLVATELGIPGYLLWCGLLWMSAKIPISIALRPPPGLDPRLLSFAEALAISTIGLLVGVFFLSFAYKQFFLVWLGLAGALHGTVRRASPGFRVQTTKWDVAGICTFAFIALIAVRLASASTSQH